MGSIYKNMYGPVKEPLKRTINTIINNWYIFENFQLLSKKNNNLKSMRI